MTARRAKFLAAGDAALRGGTGGPALGPLVAHLLHLLLVVAELETHVNDAADPVLVVSHLRVPAGIALPAPKTTLVNSVAMCFYNSRNMWDIVVYLKQFQLKFSCPRPRHQ